MFAADLVIATLTISTLSFFAFHVGRRVRSNYKLLFVCIMFAAVVFSICFQGRLELAKLVPYSAAVLLSNLTPIFVAFVVGFASHGLQFGKRTKPVVVTVLAMLAVICLFAPLIRPAIAPPSIDPNGLRKGLVILQSHDATCAPASAATLLTLNGIVCSERDMIKPCLTSKFGTEALGLYRGIKIGCRGKKADVRIANVDPQLWLDKKQLPNVALVRFKDDEFGEGLADIHLRERSMNRPDWFSGNNDAENGHAVVVVGYTDGKWTIADPAIGMVKWSDDEMRKRFTGDAIFIAK